MTKKRCRIHYRRITRTPSLFPAETLSNRIAAALNQQLPDGSTVRGRVVNRVWSANQEDTKRALNNFYIHDDYVFGTLCTFSPGEMQALLRLIGDEEQPRQSDLAQALQEWDIAEQTAPEGHEYLHGMAYWLAIDDHFYVIQHSALQAKAIEEYFTWLLRDKTGVIGADGMVMLQVVFDRAQLGDDDLNSIHVGGLVPETVRAAPAALPGAPVETESVESEVRESIADRLQASFTRGKKIIEDLLGPLEAQRIIESVPPEAALDVSVNIGYRATKRKLKRAFMGELARGLRNIADGEIQVLGKNGTAKGDDARLSMDMNIQKVSDGSSLLDLEDTRNQMLEVHRRFLHDEKLNGDPG